MCTITVHPAALPWAVALLALGCTPTPTPRDPFETPAPPSVSTEFGIQRPIDTASPLPPPRPPVMGPR